MSSTSNDTSNGREITPILEMRRGMVAAGYFLSWHSEENNSFHLKLYSAHPTVALSQ